MAGSRSFTKLFSILVLGALGFVLAPESAWAWGRTPTIPTKIDHHGIEIRCGNLNVVLGELNPTEGEYTIQQTGNPTIIRFDSPNATCEGKDVTGVSTGTAGTLLGSGQFHIQVDYTIPRQLGSPTGLPPTLRCDGSLFTVQAFCRAGVTVTGFMTWIDPDPAMGDTPPRFTNCLDDSTDCTLQLGGLPSPLTQCPDVFPEDTVNPGRTLAATQMLFFQQQYNGSCASFFEPPAGEVPDPTRQVAYGRACHSDLGPLDPPQDYDFLGGNGFDGGGERGCVVVDEAEFSVHYHTTTHQVTAQIQDGAPGGGGGLTVVVKPETINLECKTKNGKVRDNGTVTATICGSPTFDVHTVNITNGSAPVLQGVKATRFSFKKTSGLCGGNEALVGTYPTCNSDGVSGLAQVLQGEEGVVTLTLEGLSTQLTLGSTPVILRGQDDISVVK